MTVLEWKWIDQWWAERDERFTGLMVRFRNDAGALMTAAQPASPEAIHDLCRSDDPAPLREYLEMLVRGCEWEMEANRLSRAGG